MRIPLAEWWIDTVLGTWEESLKSLIREAFANGTRVVNGFFSWVVAALPKDPALGRSPPPRTSQCPCHCIQPTTGHAEWVPGLFHWHPSLHVTGREKICESSTARD